MEILKNEFKRSFCESFNAARASAHSWREELYFLICDLMIALVVLAVIVATINCCAFAFSDNVVATTWWQEAILKIAKF